MSSHSELSPRGHAWQHPSNSCREIPLLCLAAATRAFAPAVIFRHGGTAHLAGLKASPQLVPSSASPTCSVPASRWGRAPGPMPGELLLYVDYMSQPARAVLQLVKWAPVRQPARPLPPAGLARRQASSAAQVRAPPRPGAPGQHRQGRGPAGALHTDLCAAQGPQPAGAALGAAAHRRCQPSTLGSRAAAARRRATGCCTSPGRSFATWPRASGGRTGTQVGLVARPAAMCAVSCTIPSALRRGCTAAGGG